ncbi:type III secretion system chaperone [Ramlibacter sp. AN1015]|uniref:type III secretion system chaperone n=1 Tax=Ramlibacter sp. AN1015 TaxID=3133428 RepID=UPI0030C22E1F
MQFHQLMQRLGVELRVPELAPNEQGACAIRLEGMTLSFYEDPDQAFSVLCPLGAVAADHREMHEALLAGNLFADGIGGSALALDGEGNAWLSQRFHPADLSFPRFLAALDRFANLADYWKERVATGTVPTFVH